MQQFFKQGPANAQQAFATMRAFGDCAAVLRSASAKLPGDSKENAEYSLEVRVALQYHPSMGRCVQCGAETRLQDSHPTLCPACADVDDTARPSPPVELSPPALALRIQRAKEEARNLLLLGHATVFESNDERNVTPANLRRLEELEAVIAKAKTRSATA